MEVSMPSTVHFPLLTNGLDFICSAIDNLQDNPGQRELKYAVLHLGSGMELILKEKILNEDWKLLFKDPNKAREEDLKTGNFESINFRKCIVILEGFGIKFEGAVIEGLYALRNKRNKLEHFGLTESMEAIVSLASFTIGFLLDFISNELTHLENNDEYLQYIRQGISGIKVFLQNRWDSIQENIKQLREDFIILKCPACLQEAAYIDDNVKCIFCGYNESSTYASEEYISNVLGIDHYRTVKDGGEWPLYTCPSCNWETLVQGENQYICFQCGETFKFSDLGFCQCCGQPYEIEKGIPSCTNCYKRAIEDD
jgi:hypothetical protein